jgi:hypothetical protein
MYLKHVVFYQEIISNHYRTQKNLVNIKSQETQTSNFGIKLYYYIPLSFSPERTGHFQMIAVEANSKPQIPTPDWTFGSLKKNPHSWAPPSEIMTQLIWDDLKCSQG